MVPVFLPDQLPFQSRFEGETDSDNYMYRGWDLNYWNSILTLLIFSLCLDERGWISSSVSIFFDSLRFLPFSSDFRCSRSPPLVQ